jgi:hypothetical protein
MYFHDIFLSKTIEVFVLIIFKISNLCGAAMRHLKIY